MIAVGIDVSKSRSTAAVLKSDGTELLKPFVFKHNQNEMDPFIEYLKEQKDKIVILMEPTGHYHYPVLKRFEEAGMPVCLINPYLMKKVGEANLRRVKTDKKDAIKLATYALEKSYKLVPHSPMEEKYENLRLLSRQYRERMSSLTRNKVHLINLLDETMPGLGQVMSLKTRDPENSLALMFIRKYGSFDNIKKMGKKKFIDSYEKLVKKSNAKSPKEGLALYELAISSITTHGDNEYAIMAQNQCLDLVIVSQKATDEIIVKMEQIAQTIPEYKVLRGMHGVGERLGPLILAEIGNVRRFHSAEALNAYAGNDPPPFESGNFESHNRHISKCGNAALRKYCYEVMQALKLLRPQDDPVYLYLIKKEQEGKPFNVAKMAAVNKFLRIYYAKVKAME